MTFVTTDAVAISIGTTAVALPSVIDGPQDKSSNGVTMLRRAPQMRITNTHASQSLFYKRNGVATATDGTLIAFGKSLVVPTPFPDDSPTLLGSGSTTTGVLEVGSVGP